MATDPKEQELIHRANQGDPSAFDDLYERYHNWVYQTAYRFTLNDQDSLDILQETYLYFFNKFPDFYLSCKLTTFLFPVIKNLSIKKNQKNRKTQSLNDLDLDPSEETTPNTESTQDSLYEYLSLLSEKHKEVILLRFGDGLEISEIAQCLNCPAGTVKSRIHHALKVLKQYKSRFK